MSVAFDVLSSALNEAVNDAKSERKFLKRRTVILEINASDDNTTKAEGVTKCDRDIAKNIINDLLKLTQRRGRLELML